VNKNISKEHRLRAYADKMLRRIFGQKKEEATRCWRKLHNLHLSPNIIRLMKQRIR